MDPMSLLKLLGIVIVVVGFALKLDSILIIMVAAVATALVAGMDPVTFLSTMGKSFVSNRSMLIFIMTFVITGTLERNGLKPRVHFTTWDDYAIMAMVESGLGVSMLTEMILQRTPFRIVAKELDVPAFRETALALRDRKTASLAVKKFLEYLQYR